MDIPQSIAEHWDVLFILVVALFGLVAALAKVINGLLNRMVSLVILPIQESQRAIADSLSKVTARLEKLEIDHATLRGQYEERKSIVEGRR